MYNDSNNLQKDKKLAKRWLNQINYIIDYKLKKISTVESAIVNTVNKNGTVDIVFPLDNTVFTNIQNQSIYRNLQVGDNVKVLKQDNNTSNMWIIGKHHINNNEVLDIDKITSMADYLIERKTQGIWTYEKWADGTLKCWGRKIIRHLDCSQAQSNNVYYCKTQIETLPFVFSTVTFFTCNGGCATTHHCSVKSIYISPMDAQTFSWNVVTHSPTASDMTIACNFEIKGTWK